MLSLPALCRSAFDTLYVVVTFSEAVTLTSVGSTRPTLALATGSHFESNAASGVALLLTGGSSASKGFWLNDSPGPLLSGQPGLVGMQAWQRNPRLHAPLDLHQGQLHVDGVGEFGIRRFQFLELDHFARFGADGTGRSFDHEGIVAWPPDARSGGCYNGSISWLPLLRCPRPRQNRAS